MNTPHYDIDVELTGTDGNIFGLIGTVKDELKKQTDIDSPMLDQFQDEVMASGGYDEALVVIMDWVNVT